MLIYWHNCCYYLVLLCTYFKSYNKNYNKNRSFIFIPNHSNEVILDVEWFLLGLKKNILMLKVFIYLFLFIFFCTLYGYWSQEAWAWLLYFFFFYWSSSLLFHLFCLYVVIIQSNMSALNEVTQWDEKMIVINEGNRECLSFWW